jgi:hypothetical protein
VEGIDIAVLGQTHIPEYRFGPPHDLWYWGYLYGFYAQDDNKRGVSFQIGVYPSVQTAEETALHYLNTISLFFMEGPIQGKSIGDNCWYAFNTNTDQKVRYISFLRKNVFVMIGIDFNAPHPPPDILELCREIDSDIMNGARYISFADKPDPPSVTSVQVAKSILREGETTIVTITGSDPKGKRLDYQGEFPGTRLEAENTFLVRFSRDNTPEPYWGTTQTFTAWVVNEDLFFSERKEFQITFWIPSTVSDEDVAYIPRSITLYQNTPNPFNSSTTIRFTLSLPRSVRLAVYSVAGQKVRTLLSGHMNAGDHSYLWDGRNDSGQHVSSGVYFSCLEGDGKTEAVRLLLIR